MNDAKRITIVASATVIILLLGFLIRTAIVTSGADKAAIYNTAITAGSGDQFNYAIDSHQGNLFAFVNVTAKTGVKYPELKSEYAYVKRIKEHYTQHTYTTCSKNSCSTHTYYTWDETDSEDQTSPQMVIYKRDYAYNTFDLSDFKHSIQDCSDLPAMKKEGSWWSTKKTGCDEGHNYIDNDNRYSYDVIPTSISGTILSDVTNGTLSPTKGNKTIKLTNSSVEQITKDVNNYTLWANVFIWIWCILFVGAGTAGAVYWAVETPYN